MKEFTNQKDVYDFLENILKKQMELAKEGVGMTITGQVGNDMREFIIKKTYYPAKYEEGFLYEEKEDYIALDMVNVDVGYDVEFTALFNNEEKPLTQDRVYLNDNGELVIEDADGDWDITKVELTFYAMKKNKKH